MKTFGEKLLHLSKSVDWLTEDHSKRIQEVIFNHLKGKEGAASIEVCLEARVQGEQGLYYTWFSEGSTPEPHCLRHPDPKKRHLPYGQTSYSFKRDCDLWIVAPDDSTLSRSDRYLDLFANVPHKDIPRYEAYTNVDGIKTSVILILRKQGGIGNRPKGLVNIEFQEKVHFHRDLKTEFDLIRKSIEILIELEYTSKLNTKNTGQAIDALRTESEVLRSLTNPTIFFAYPKDHDSAVISSILQSLQRAFPNMRVVNWESIDEWGNINEQIIDKFNSASFGVCYLSQRHQGTQRQSFTYSDNPNVLFEAGMFHGRAHTPGQDLVKWIPIREHENLTGKLPFDLRNERLVVVPRHKDGRLKTSDFKALLAARFAKLHERP